jgi:O-acetyl-ADP-ribose deacetylase (regulator of RNase III)
VVEIVKGNFWDREADARVNLINCVGTMGTGVAYQFASRYPAMLKPYREQCKNRRISPGDIWLWEAWSGSTLIYNMATKDDWRDPSQYRWVESGLSNLRRMLMDRTQRIITLPAPGCGNGGLSWDLVRDLCMDNLRDIPQTVLLFEPAR